MYFNDLLQARRIDPNKVLVLRHRPHESQLDKVLPWLVAERPDLFSAYQQTQGQKLERVMLAITGNGYVASFIRRESSKALFVGLYSITASTPLSYEEFWQDPSYAELKKLGMKGWDSQEAGPSSILRFDLRQLTDFYAEWKGRLIVQWPGSERSWWRRAHQEHTSELR